MPKDTENRKQYFRKFKAALTRRELPDGDPYYVALYPAGFAVIDEMFSEIDISTLATSQLITGPRGCGKSTELLRLKRRLELQGFSVVFVNIEEYLSLEREVELTDFLTAVALGVVDSLGGVEQPGRLRRLFQFLGSVRLEAEPSLR
jgi:hypothetical protein